MRLAIISGLLLLVLFILREAFKDRTWKEGFWWLLGFSRKKEEEVVENLKVAVIIPAYNEEGYVDDTIDSVKHQTRKPDRIIVVDDCSSDNTKAEIEKKGVELIQTPENTGSKGKVQNYALEFIDEEDYSVVIIIDADTILDEKAIERILPHLRDPEVGSACGFVIPKKIRTIWEKARFVQYLWSISVAKTAQSLWSAPLVSSGCFSAFKMDFLKSSGVFLPAP